MLFKWNRLLANPTMLDLKGDSKYERVNESTIELTEGGALNEDKPVTAHRVTGTRAFWLFGPILAFVALSLSAGCIGLTFIVLYWSNNDAVANWPFQPSVYLSILTSVDSALLVFALGKALPIAWWRHALRGRTVAELHDEWAVGTSLWEALTNWRFLGMTALAGISCALLRFCGPLLQKASTVVEAVPVNSVDLQFHLAPELPTGWSGTLNADGSYAASDAFNIVFADYLQGKTISANVTGCDGTCVANVSAPGLATSPERCSSVTLDLNANEYLDQWPQTTPGYYLLFSAELIFSYLPNETWFGPSIPSSSVPTKLPLRDPDRESVAIVVAYSDVKDYVGSMTISQCWFVSGVLEYNVVVRHDGTTISLNNDHGEQPVIKLSDNTSPLRYNTTMDTTIRNVMASSSIIFSSSYGLAGDSIDSFLYQQDDLNTFALRQINKNRNTEIFHASDPMPAILSSLNEMLFRGGVAAAADWQASYGSQSTASIEDGLNITQKVSGERIDKVSRFHSLYRFWIGASIIQAVAIILTGAVLWGWWRIGRPVSFSPVEIAKAFDAPTLENAYSNGRVEEIVKDVGKVRLRYGIKDGNANEDMNSGSNEGKLPGGQLVFGKYEDISPPRKSQLFAV